ncbi:MULTISPECIES: helix-turn-helix domain-containing protein [unclassified Microbacterium]|uniref:helix-turn-helix domain-containing protein n=1 Tax=unclassified Microbacterium TaxID=2609290 RepID=UPI003C2E8C5F
MELHASDEEVERQASQAEALRIAQWIAGDLRAEMARQKRTGGELAEVLGISAHTAGRRLKGDIPFDVIELAAACDWLGISLVDVVRRAQLPQVVAS